MSNNPVTVHDSFGVANFSVGITERDINLYSVTLFVNNAFDEDFASGIADVSAIYNDAKTLMHHIPRAAERYAGVRVRLSF